MSYKGLQNGSDIRGVAMGDSADLTPKAVSDLTLAFVSWLSEKTGTPASGLRIAIGRDSRLSGEALLSVSAAAASRAGASVLDCGLASTPAMFMAAVFEKTAAAGSIMLTASHLPSERNGMKFFTREGGLDKKDIAAIIAIADGLADSKEACAPEKAGTVEKTDLMDLYCAHLRDMISGALGGERPLEGLHIVCDAGNGAGGFYVSGILEPLGADCSGSLFLEPDGTFPNHQPNPENAAAMACICEAVKREGADLGLIFDTDVDRAAAVDSKGRPIARNGIVALASVIASEGHPGTTIVTDSITSVQLADFLTKDLGLRHFRYRRGYRNVINKAVELNAAGTDCQLAIETSGHAALKENYFLDDGAYLAAKIVIEAARLRRKGGHIEDLLSGLEEPLEAKEIRIKVNAPDFAAYADKVLSEVEKTVEAGFCHKEKPCEKMCGRGMSLEKPNYEGVRVNVAKDFGDGWFLLRKSLHDPLMPLNIESNKEGGVEQIIGEIRWLLAPYTELEW